MTGPFSVDRAGVATIAVLAFVVWPALILATLWGLGVLHPTQMGWVEVAVAVAVAGVGLTAPWMAWKQLRGAVGIEISDEGIAAGGTRIGWSEVTAVEEPMFGTLLIRAGSRTIEVQTYFFRQREQLRRFVVSKVAPHEAE